VLAVVGAHAVRVEDGHEIGAEGRPHETQVGVDVGFSHGVEFDWHGGRFVGADVCVVGCVCGEVYLWYCCIEVRCNEVVQTYRTL